MTSIKKHHHQNERKKERKKKRKQKKTKKEKEKLRDFQGGERYLWGDIRQVVAEGKEQNRKEKRGTTER